MKENRPRSFTRARITGRVLIHDESRLYIAPMRDISAGGVFIHYLTNLPVGREVRLVLKSASLPCTIQAMGKVVRVEDGPRKGLAVEFFGLNAKDLIRIRDYVLGPPRRLSKRQASD